MEWLIENFQQVFLISFMPILMISGLIWGMLAGETRLVKLPKKIFLLFLMFALVTYIFSKIFLTKEVSYKVPTSEIVTGTVIDQNDRSTTYYKWKNFILPNTINSYLSVDTITMIRTYDPWELGSKRIILKFIISDEKPAKPKKIPVPVDVTPVNKIEK